MTEPRTTVITPPKHSPWVCYLFGSRKGGGLCWRPYLGQHPNWFARWMMRICFSCRWVKEPE